MTTKQHSYTLTVNSLTQIENAAKALNYPTERTKIVTAYADRFSFLYGEEQNLTVSLEQLWEALETPYYSAQGDESSLPQIPGSEKRRTKTEEELYKRRKFNQWKSEVVIPNCLFDLKEVKTGRGGKRIDTYIHTEDAKMISMLANNSAGREARQYFLAMEAMLVDVNAYNLKREKFHRTDKDVFKATASSKGWSDYGKRLATDEMIRTRTISKKVAGSRNIPETNKEEYEEILSTVARMVLKGKSTAIIEAALL